MTLFSENAKDNKCICESFIEKNKRVFDLEKENEELWTHSAYLTALIEKMKCCANCKHSEQGEYDEFENCSRCHTRDCYCRIEQQTRNSAGKYHDWDDKCDKWEIKELAE